MTLEECAQRLSASTNEEPDLLIRIADAAGAVLNAFRHQRTRNLNRLANRNCVAPMCSTPFGINERGTGGDPVLEWQAKKCSTPFGINERGTGSFFVLNPIRFAVLNAFRHQRTRNGGAT